MAEFEITSPNGETFVVTAPDDASEQQVLSYARSQFSMKPSEAQKSEPEKPMDMRGLVRQALQGATFGFSDEIGAGIASVPASIATGNNIVDVYNDMHQHLQDERNQFKKDNPKAALAAELGGGLLTGGYGATRMGAAKAMQNIRPLAKAGIIGGTEGAIYGFGSGDRGKRAEGAAIGGVSGVVGAPLVSGLSSVAGHLARPVVDRLRKSVYGSAGGDAREYLASLLAREGVNNLDQMAKGGARQMETLADVSQSGRSALEGIVSSVDSPRIQSLAKKTLEGRNAGQQGRLFDSLDDGLSTAGKSFREVVTDLKTTRGEKAKPLYDAARQKPVRMTDYMKAVFDPERGVPEVKAALAEATKRTATKRAAGQQVGHIDVLDEMKRVLDDDINALMRQGKNNRVRDLIQVKNNILNDIDKQIPEYKQARSAFAGDSELIDAAELGTKIFKQDVDHLDDIMKAMGDSEKEMFRVGAKKAIREKLMMGREGTNSINRIASELNLEKISKAFPSEAAFNRFKSELKFEANIFETSRVLHNSMTALRQASQKDMDKGGSELMEVMGHDTAGLVANSIRRIFSQGLSPEAKEELGVLLLMPIRSLPEDLIKRLEKTVVKQLPQTQQSKAVELFKKAASSTANTLPGVGAAAVSNSEV